MNRRQRRAQNSTDHIRTADDIPSSPPPDALKSRNPNTKTLLDIAAERQAELLGSSSNFKANFQSAGRRKAGKVNVGGVKPEDIVQVKIGENGTIVPEHGGSLPPSILQAGKGGASDSEAGSELPWLDTLLLASSLSALHFTLSVLAMHQYAEELRFPPLIRQTLFIAFPTLATLIALFHGHLLPRSLVNLPPSAQVWTLALRSLVYVITANVAGCYLIQLTNDGGYYAVVKDAPSVGTIWVWAVLEMGLLGALAGVVGPGVYAWWWGYGIL